MPNEICPRCNTLQDMIISSHEKDGEDINGKTIKVVTKNYHCSVCNTFIYSQDEPVAS